MVKLIIKGLQGKIKELFELTRRTQVFKIIQDGFSSCGQFVSYRRTSLLQGWEFERC
jgi:anti-anti-sigma regulatory factor